MSPPAPLVPSVELLESLDDPHAAARIATAIATAASPVIRRRFPIVICLLLRNVVDGQATAGRSGQEGAVPRGTVRAAAPLS